MGLDSMAGFRSHVQMIFGGLPARVAPLTAQASVHRFVFRYILTLLLLSGFRTCSDIF